MLKSTLLVSSSNGPPPRTEGVGSEYLSFVVVGVFDDDGNNGDEDNGEDIAAVAADLSWVGSNGTAGSGSMSVQSCPGAGP